MDFKKIFDQAVREIKREVNLKVLNVPEIEQKVLDATSDEPWGPHGSELSEIAQATTRNFLECEMVMNVLWQRLSNTKANWIHLYKSLVAIEYLIANGSERVVNDIYDNISQITALSRFECVEPNGKDVGLCVRKKSEAILSISDDREKLEQVREKAAATRDKYIGLSSTGMSYNSSSASFSVENYESSNRYRGTNRPKEADLFVGDKETKLYNNIERDQYTTEKVTQKSRESTSKDEFEEDFNPRAVTGTYGSADKSSKRVDLFVPNLMDDTMDTPASTPNLETTSNNVQEEADLFADATFQSATSNLRTTAVQGNIDLFANISSEAKFNSSISGNKIDNSVDPFAAIPLNNSDACNNRTDQTTETEFEFGAFTSSTETHEKAKTKDGTFQIKSGIWADSLSRGLIDLDITATKKNSLTDKKDSTLSQSQFPRSK